MQHKIFKHDNRVQYEKNYNMKRAQHQKNTTCNQKPVNQERVQHENRVT